MTASSEIQRQLSQATDLLGVETINIVANETATAQWREPLLPMLANLTRSLRQLAEGLEQPRQKVLAQSSRVYRLRLSRVKLALLTIRYGFCHRFIQLHRALVGSNIRLRYRLVALSLLRAKLWWRKYGLRIMGIVLASVSVIAVVHLAITWATQLGAWLMPQIARLLRP